jgi:hypothetical protein
MPAIAGTSHTAGPFYSIIRTKKMERIKRIKEKLIELKQLDKAFSIFGSERHKYRLNNTLSLNEISQIESTNNIILSEEYKQILNLIGNGDAGCGYGLEKLNIDKINPPYIGTDKLLRNCKDPSKIELDMINIDELSGYIKIFDYGCGMEQCLIVNGEEIGGLIFFDCDGRFEKIENKTILDIYEDWLDESLDKLKRIQSKLEVMTLNEVIDSEREIGNYFINSHILSIIGAKEMKYGFYDTRQENHLAREYDKWKNRDRKPLERLLNYIRK